jgi:hypothetical protein
MMKWALIIIIVPIYFLAHYLFIATTYFDSATRDWEDAYARGDIAGEWSAWNREHAAYDCEHNLTCFHPRKSP